MTTNIRRPTGHDEKELAYLYDLYVVPTWREPFDRMVDEEVKLPTEGRVLEAGCGTGGYAVDLACRIGQIEVVGVDEQPERLVLARAKAEIKQQRRVTFRPGSMTALDLPKAEFDWVLGDASLLPPVALGPVCAELARVAKPGAPLVLKLATRGSFDEFFSLYWEALYELGLTALTPQLERLTTERPTVADAEALAAAAGWREAAALTRTERFLYADAPAFLTAPLITALFLEDWLALLPDERARAAVCRYLPVIIDRERGGMEFEVSIKATLLVGRK